MEVDLLLIFLLAHVGLCLGALLPVGCGANPCQNWGECLFKNNTLGYECNCPSAFEGINCEYPRFHSNHAGKCKVHAFSTQPFNATQMLPIAAAEKVCEEIGGVLAMAKTEATNAFLTAAARFFYPGSQPVFFWIGGGIRGNEWHWVDKTKINQPNESGYSNWDEAPTASNNETARCLTMKVDLNTSTWVDAPCTSGQGYMCEVTTEKDICADKICPNNSHCASLECHSRCDCDAGYFGSQCENDKIELEVLDSKIYFIEGQTGEISVNISTYDGFVHVGAIGKHLARQDVSNVGNETTKFVYNNVKLTDAGGILISATPTSQAYVKSVELELIVHAGARIKGLSSRTIEIPSVNKTMNTTCFVSGFPTPSVAWYHDGDILVSRDNKNNLYQVEHQDPLASTLHIVNIGFIETGKYTCKATNTIGRNMLKFSSLEAAIIYVFHVPNVTSVERSGCSPDLTVLWKPHPESLRITYLLELKGNTKRYMKNVYPKRNHVYSTLFGDLEWNSTYTITITPCPVNKCNTSYTSKLVSVSTDTELYGRIAEATISEDNTENTCRVTWKMELENVSEKTQFEVTIFGSNDSRPLLTTKTTNLTYDFEALPGLNYSASIKAHSCEWMTHELPATGTCVIIGNAAQTSSGLQTMGLFISISLVCVVFVPVLAIVLCLLARNKKESKMKSSVDDTDQIYDDIAPVEAATRNTEKVGDEMGYMEPTQYKAEQELRQDDPQCTVDDDGYMETTFQGEHVYQSIRVQNYKNQ